MKIKKEKNSNIKNDVKLDGVRTILKNIPPEYVNFIQKPNNIFKNIEYQKCFKNARCTYSDILETDTNIYFNEVDYDIKKYNNNFLLRKARVVGFNYNKNTKKIVLWAGCKQSHLETYCIHKYKWYKNYLTPYLTKTTIEKIINGNITSPTLLCKHYLKINKLYFPPKLFHKIISIGDIDKNYLLALIYRTKDPNIVYNAFKNSTLITLDNEYDIFGFKINNVKNLTKKYKQSRLDMILLKLIKDTDVDIVTDELYNNTNIILPADMFWIKTKKQLMLRTSINIDFDLNGLFVDYRNTIYKIIVNSKYINCVIYQSHRNTDANDILIVKNFCDEYHAEIYNSICIDTPITEDTTIKTIFSSTTVFDSFF
jgi:hypothetical protein